MITGYWQGVSNAGRFEHKIGYVSNELKWQLFWMVFKDT
jgi:hypothetical protein